MPGRQLFHATSLATLILACIATPVLAQQAKNVFCLADGTTIGVERFEARDGKYFLYVAGATTPLEYPASAVRGIDSPYCGVAPASRAFGIHGSNTIGERLMPMLIEAFAVKRFGSRPQVKPTQPEEQEITLRSGAETKAMIDFKAKGSGTAAKGLVEGKALIGMSSRQMKVEEAEPIKAKLGVDPFGPGSEHILAMDGLAVIVSEDNPVQRLTLDQLCRIFSGETSSWRDVGGPDRPISLYRRDNKSGTFDTFKHLVLDTPACKKPIAASARAFESSELLSASVAKDPGGIGFVAMPYLGRNRALEIASSCGVASAPSRFSIKSEEYPLARRLYLYSLGVPSDPVAAEILRFALSDEAQGVVTDAEFFNLAVEFQDPEDQLRWAKRIADEPTTGLPPDKDVPRRAVQPFASTITQMRRASMELRFESGSYTLDTRAMQDIDRLARYLQSSGMAGKRFLIAGFADSDGAWPTNDRLAYKRAETVADHLRRAGVRVAPTDIRSFAYLAPVACNDTDAGKSKNRRVEVWIAR